MTQARNTTAMHSSPRCGARTRCGSPCKAPAVRGKARCRKHGGAKGSGAPAGNRNRFVHGLYSLKELARTRAIRDLIRDAKALLKELE